MLSQKILVILALAVLTTVSIEGQTNVEVLHCDSLRLTDGKTARVEATVNVAESLKSTCFVSALTTVTWRIGRESLCSVPISGCNTKENAEGCACVSHTGDILTVSVRWTFNKTKHAREGLDLLPDCLPNTAYASRTKCTLNEYKPCEGVNCGHGKCLDINLVGTCNCSGTFRTGKHCDVLPCSKKDCDGSTCGVKVKTSQLDHEAVCIHVDKAIVSAKKACSVGQCDKDCCSMLYLWLVGTVLYFGVVAAAVWNARRMYPAYSHQVQDALARQTQKMQGIKEEESQRFKPSTSAEPTDDSEYSKASPDTSDVDSSVAYDDKYEDPKLQAKYNQDHKPELKNKHN